MNIARAFSILIALGALCEGSIPRAMVTVKQHQLHEKHSCAISIVAVDGRLFKSPQQLVSFSPGRHVISLRVRYLLGNLPEADAPLDTTFEAHRYTIDGELSSTGALKLLFVDEDKRPPGVKVPKTK